MPTSAGPLHRRAAAALARPALVIGVVAVLWLVRPGVVENGLRSPRVWLAVAASLIAGRLVSLAVGRLSGRASAGALAGNAVLVAIGVVLLAPSFQQRTVEEPFAAMVTGGAAAPAVVAEGRLDGIGHSADGSVVLYRTGDGLVVRFEGVDVEGTPGPFVHLVAAGQDDPDGGVLLGGLTAERGSFSYRLPPGTDLRPPFTVLVWCRPFATPVAAALLTA